MKYSISSFVLCAFAFMAGCSGSGEGKVHYDNKLFIVDGHTPREMRVSEGAAALSGDITLGIAKPQAGDITARLDIAPKLLSHFREAFYEPDAQLLPTGHYDNSPMEVTIRSGKMVSEAIKMKFTGFDALDMDKTWVLPVTISHSNIKVLAGARTLYWIFKKSSLVNVVAEIVGRTSKKNDIPDNKLWPGPGNWNDPTPVSNLSAFTLETLVNINAFDNDEIATVMGIEDVFLIRLGDNGIPINQLQVAWGKSEDGSVSRGGVTDPSLKLKAGQWYHIAVTFDGGDVVVYLDGRCKAAANSSPLVSSVNFGTQHLDEEVWGQPRGFWIGYSYADGRCLNGKISETRIWNRALSPEEIQARDHFYKVDAASAGLVAYWKFDEGSGSVIKDHTRWGNNLVAAKPLTWHPVALPAKDKE